MINLQLYAIVQKPMIPQLHGPGTETQFEAGYLTP